MDHEHDRPGRGRELFPLLTPAPTTVTDPVCGMSVDPATAPASSVYQGRTYSFCCPSCKQRFDQDPERYLHGGPAGHTHAPEPPPAPPPAGTPVEYVCPMDPDVVSDRPGACPKCG